MLSLVDYGSGSDEEEQEVEVPATTSNGNELDNTSLFHTLPQPITTDRSVIEEDQDEFLLKKESSSMQPKPKSIKITIPSLDEFNSDDEEESVKDNSTMTKQAKKVSGLFTILPPPKTTPLSTTSFIPNVLKRPTSTKGKTIVPHQMKSAVSATVATPSKIKDERRHSIDSESEDEGDVSEMPEVFTDEMWNQVCGKKNRKHIAYKRKIVETPRPVTIPKVEIAPEAKEPYNGLDNDAFKELVGNSKRRRENIKLIDINEDEVRPDKEDWLKGLTDPQHAPKLEVEEPLDHVAKRKHHITYLAQQAKANDTELQNQWAQNRFNRKMSAVKYGF